MIGAPSGLIVPRGPPWSPGGPAGSPPPRLPLGGQGLEPGVVAVEDVLVAGQAAAGRVLPERVETPAPWQCATAAGGVVGDPQRVVVAKAAVVAGAGGPPVGGAVDHRVDVLLVGVLVHEVPDPRPHLRTGEPVALAAVGVVLDVERAGQGLPVGRPAAAVPDEIFRLGLPGGIVRDREVISAADEAVVVRPYVLVIEIGVCVVGAFGRLRVGEIKIGRYVGPVDVALIGADVYAGDLQHSDRRPH